MPIPFTCSCGKSLRVNDDLAGRKVRCPACTGIQIVPTPAVAEVELVELDEIPSERVQAKPPAVPPPLPVMDPSHRLPPPLPAFQMEPIEDDVEEDRPRRRRRRPERSSRRDGGGGASPAEIIGGVAMMVISVIWFVAGLAFDYIFFYPPVLFIAGIVVIVKGATKSN